MSARGKFTEIEEEVKKLMIKVCNVEVEVKFENQKKRIIWNDLRGSILKQLLRQASNTNPRMFLTSNLFLNVFIATMDNQILHLVLFWKWEQQKF
jgi:hypothetical protein